MKISKPNMTSIWAEGGSVAVVPSEKISQGWVVEIPPCEQMNFVQNRQDAGIAYMLQQGIPEWGSSTEFQATSYVQYAGIVYKGLGVSLNKQPDLFPTYWEKAFDNAGSAQTVQDQINAIEADPDPFGQYLLETDAAKYGIKTDLFATNLLDETNLNVIEDGVWQYTTTCTNSPFPYGKISQLTSGVVKYQFVESLSGGVASRTSTSGVFTAWQYAVTHTAPATYQALQEQINTLIAGQEALVESQKIKIYGLFLTTVDFLSPSEVATYLGYGGWERYAEGKALVGRSTQPSTPAWTQTMNNGFGEYAHSLSASENGAHTHTSAGQAGIGQGASGSNTVQQAAGNTETSTSGLGAPHNNVQPSIVIGVWRRVG